MKKHVLSAALVAIAAAATAQPCNETLLASYNNPVCLGKDLSLTATSITGATYEWEGPGGFLSFVRNTTVSNTTLLHSGDYIVRATVGACVYADTVNVDVLPLPVTPTITYVKPPCLGDSLLLKATTTGGAHTYLLWDPSGNPLVPIGNITPANNGIYSAVAINTSGCVSDTAKLNVAVQPIPPTPTVTLTKTACTGDSILLSASGPGGISSFLFFDQNDNPVPSKIAGITFAHTGIYKCVAISSAGCFSDTGTVSVLVHPTVKPGVAIYGSGEAGLYGNVTFTSFVSKAGTVPTYTWMRNGAAIPGASGSTYTAVNGWTIMPGDVITLQVKSDATPCPATSTSNAITIATNLSVNDMDKTGGYAIFPNPTKGMIHIKTNLNGAYKVDILNAIGSVVYHVAGRGDLSLDMTGVLPAGNYIIRISGDGHTVSNKLQVAQ